MCLMDAIMMSVLFAAVPAARQPWCEDGGPVQEWPVSTPEQVE